VRIIGGTVGGRTLKSKKGRDTRPTADRVREAIFNMLLSRSDVPARVLDLYAGTGAMGLEALSRGAGQAVFVESDPGACVLIRENAAALGFASAAQVVEKKVLSYEPEGRFGWIFLDPPYASHELEKALRRAAAHLDDGGVAVAEHDWRKAPEAQPGLALEGQRRYGQTGVSIFRRET
jgi:16S rRNA (guanine(966)-N(2))-methyltransferase RsmD